MLVIVLVLAFTINVGATPASIHILAGDKLSEIADNKLQAFSYGFIICYMVNTNMIL